MYTLVIPIYNNADFAEPLAKACADLNSKLGGTLEVIMIDDGSRDGSPEALRKSFAAAGLRYQVSRHARNFGSFAAIRSGLEIGKGPYFAVMAADLQEPPSLILDFFRILSAKEANVVLGKRRSRKDPFGSVIFANVFWGLVRKLINPDIPKGGVDIFGCDRQFRDLLLSLKEHHTSLIGQLFWLGMTRKFVEYDRLERAHGTSGWSFRKRLKYFSDTLFSFSDLPVRVLLVSGIVGIVIAIGLMLVVFAAKFLGRIEIPGYAATLSVILFFAALNSFGLGLIGSYVWRAYENTKGRPISIIHEEN